MEASGKRQFLIDGFPRSLENLEAWDAEMNMVSRTKFMLFLDCPERVMVERLIKRGETSGRTDDNEESIRKRYSNSVYFIFGNITSSSNIIFII